MDRIQPIDISATSWVRTLGPSVVASRANFLPFSRMLLPALFMACLALTQLASRKCLDGHEVLVAQTAREMLASGDWWHPTFSGEPRYQKPPLAYWLASIASRATGQITDWSARLPSVVASVTLVAIITLAATRWFGPRVGFHAGWIQATSLWMLFYGASAIIDATLALLVASAILVVASDRLLPTPFAPWIAILAFWTLAALAVLAKGPVGLVFILPVAILYRLDRSRHVGMPYDFRFVRSWWHIPGVILFCAIAGSWPASILMERPDVFTIWMDQSVGRFSSHYGEQTRPWYYYIYQVPFLTLPWTPLWLLWFIPMTRTWSNRGVESTSLASPETRLLWYWFGVGLLFLSLSAGKREHYILPALTPLSILAAIQAERLLQRLSCRRRTAVETVTLLLITLTYLISAFIVPRHWDKWSPARTIVKRNSEIVQQADLVVLFGSSDHSPLFFVDRPMVWTSDPRDARQLATSSREALLLLPSSKLDSLQTMLPLVEIDRERDMMLVRALDPRR